MTTKKREKKKNKWERLASVSVSCLQVCSSHHWRQERMSTCPQAEGLVWHCTVPISAQWEGWLGLKKAPFYLFEEERKAAAIFLGVGDSWKYVLWSCSLMNVQHTWRKNKSLPSADIFYSLIAKAALISTWQAMCILYHWNHFSLFNSKNK